MIIILNGTSSSGKSSTAAALQRIMDAPLMHTGLDHFIFMLPRQYLSPPLWEQVYRYEWNADKTEILSIEAGELGLQLMDTMYKAATSIAQSGFPVVMDHVILHDLWLQKCLDALQNVEVLFVGLHCPLAVLEERERDRQDRTLGQAKAQYDVIHAGKIYDLEIDTSQYKPDECARMIKDYLTSGKPLTAFQKMRA